MKKILSVSLLTTSLLASSAGIIHAEEKPAKEPHWKQTAEYQQLQAVQSQSKELTAQLKAQGEKNKAVWDLLRGDVPKEARAVVKAAMAELKPLREAKKTNKEKALELQQEIKKTVASAKEAYNNEDATWQSALSEAIDLTKQVNTLKTEMLSQKVAIYEALQ